MSALSRLRPRLAELLDVEIGSRGRLSVRLQVGQRHQRVRLSEHGSWLRLESRVARERDLATRSEIPGLHQLLLAKNERAELLSLQLDERGRVVVVCDLPAQAPAEEVARAARRVAREGDRLEELWIGDDVE